MCVCVFRQSAVSDSAAPYTVASQAPLSMGFYRQEFWSRLPFPTPRRLKGIFTNTGNILLFKVSLSISLHL